MYRRLKKSHVTVPNSVWRGDRGGSDAYAEKRKMSLALL